MKRCSERESTMKRMRSRIRNTVGKRRLQLSLKERGSKDRLRARAMSKISSNILNRSRELRDSYKKTASKIK